MFRKLSPDEKLDREFRRESHRLRKDTRVKTHIQKTIRKININHREREKSRWLSDLKKPMFTLVLVENQHAMDEGNFSAFLVRGWKNLFLTYLDLLGQHPTSTVWVFSGCKNSLEDVHRYRTISTTYILKKIREKHLHERLSKYC